MNDFERFEAEKYIRSIGSKGLVDDMEMKLLYIEEKAFRLVAWCLFFALFVIICNYFIW